MLRLRLGQEHHSHAHAHERVAVPGLQNLGNTCFFNAILQALASVESFRDYLIQVVAQSRQRNRHVPFTRALADCIADLAPVGEHEHCGTVVPRDLNRELCTRLVSFRGNKQQDSQELLQFLINMVNDEQKKCARRDGGLSDLFPNFGLGSVSESSTASDDGSQDLSSFSGSISDLCFEEAMEERRWNPLYGLQVDLLQCTGCGRYRPMTNRRFLDVSLSFGENPTSKKPVTLWDCLRLYTAPELISGVECTYCTAVEELALKRSEYLTMQRKMDANPAACDIETELTLHQLKDEIYMLDSKLRSDADVLFHEEIADARCRALRDCHKRLQFSRCPEVFCFHFNRKIYQPWSGHARKLDTHVVFPIELDMSPFCRYEQSSNHHNDASNGHSNGKLRFASSAAAAVKERRFLIYELVAVILHHGNERGGHFTAYRRVRRSAQWFFISDDSVREVSEDEVLGSCAYMLFYERKHRARSRSASSSTSSCSSGSDEAKRTALNNLGKPVTSSALNGFLKRVLRDDEDDDIDDDDEEDDDDDDTLSSVPDEAASLR